MSNWYVNLLEQIKNNGTVSAPRGKQIHELINASMTIESNEIISLEGIRDVANAHTNEGKYLRAEFIWYMSGRLKVDYISKFGSMWAKLVNNIELSHDASNNIAKDINRQVNSNYGYHVFYKDATFPITFENLRGDKKFRNPSMFEYVCEELNRDRDSRKAIIQYTWPIIYFDGVNDFTCTQNQHFMIRNNELINIINIRSSDAIKGLTFDVPWWSIVGQMVAQKLNCKYGKMIVNMNNSHFYDSDIKLIDNILENKEKLQLKSLVLKDFETIKQRMIEIYDELRVMCETCHLDKNKYDKIFSSDFRRVLPEFDSISLIMVISSAIVEIISCIPNIELDRVNDKVFNSIFDIR